jgi:transposase
LIKFVAQEQNVIKLCIFVDGLDEFDGLDADMAKLFSLAADMQNVKVCASSRPHVVFENAFVDRPALRLQDLTHGDIQAYIEDRLVQDPSMQDLSTREPEETAELVKEIVTAADGVFLWVYLVVEGLLRGLGNCDEISDLKRKLRLLPKYLKQLYHYMILKVDEDYKEEAVSFFQLVNSTQPVENDSTELRPMTLLSLCLAKERIEKLPLLAETCVRSPETLIRCCYTISRRLKSRTGGLLEVQLQGARTNKIAPGMKVGYLHRTVREFLTTNEMREVLQAETSIDPDYEMLKASVYEIQIQYQKSDREELCRSALQYARRAELRNLLGSRHIFLIDQLHGINPRKYLETYIGPSNFRDENTYERFLRPAVQWDLHSYVRRKLESNPHSPTSAQKISLLYISLSKEYIICPKMILTLLSIGADPFDRVGENAGNALLLPIRGEAVSQQRLILFYKAIEYLGSSSTCSSYICYPKSNGAQLDPSLHDWAEVLRNLLGVLPESLEEKPRPISLHLRRASEVISLRFREYPSVEEELQRCLISASPREKVLAKPIYPASRPPEEKEDAQIHASTKKFCCFQ